MTGSSNVFGFTGSPELTCKVLVLIELRGVRTEVDRLIQHVTLMLRERAHVPQKVWRDHE
jgi:hypothetical protein